MGLLPQPAEGGGGGEDALEEGWAAELSPGAKRAEPQGRENCASQHSSKFKKLRDQTSVGCGEGGG